MTDTQVADALKTLKAGIDELVRQREHLREKAAVDGPAFIQGRSEGHSDVAAQLRQIIDPADEQHLNLPGLLASVRSMQAELKCSNESQEREASRRDLDKYRIEFWRRALEDAMGVAHDVDNHTIEWFAARIREDRALGNRPRCDGACRTAKSAYSAVAVNALHDRIRELKQLVRSLKHECALNKPDSVTESERKACHSIAEAAARDQLDFAEVAASEESKNNFLFGAGVARYICERILEKKPSVSNKE